MNQMNQMIYEGTVASIGDMETLPSGTTVLTLSICNSREYRKSDGTKETERNYIETKAFGKSAEVIKRFAREEDPVRVVGRLKQERWTNSNGKIQSRIVIVGEHFELPELGKRRNQAEPEKAAQKVENDGMEL